MNKVERIMKHLQEHPTDYVSVIALYKARSDAIEHELLLRKIEKRKKIAECKRRIGDVE